jgi:hypothetical protein
LLHFVAVDEAGVTPYFVADATFFSMGFMSADLTDLKGRKGSLSDRTVATAQQVLGGERRGWRVYLVFAGPAVIASIAYVDPGNFATNIQAGAKFGYGLLWVVLLANVIAMLFQALSAKLGIVTGRNLAELCRERFAKPTVLAMWVISEIAAMATDLAEFLGGAIGLSLLFHLPLFVGMVVTAIATYALLMFQNFGFRPIELIIGCMVSIIALCYLVEIFIVPIDWLSAAVHTVVPQIADSQALLLAVGIIGATVMPHAVYLHSGLTQARMPVRDDSERRKLVRFSNLEVIIALTIKRLSRRPSGSGRNRNRLPHADAAFWRWRGGGVLGLADRIGNFRLDRRNDGRPDDHARLRRLSHPDLAAPAGDHAAGNCDCRPRRQRDERIGHQSGRAQHRAAIADDRAHHFYRPARYHGSLCQ